MRARLLQMRERIQERQRRDAAVVENFLELGRRPGAVAQCEIREPADVRRSQRGVPSEVHRHHAPQRLQRRRRFAELELKHRLCRDDTRLQPAARRAESSRLATKLIGSRDLAGVRQRFRRVAESDERTRHGQTARDPFAGTPPFATQRFDDSLVGQNNRGALEKLFAPNDCVRVRTQFPRFGEFPLERRSVGARLEHRLLVRPPARRRMA